MAGTRQEPLGRMGACPQGAEFTPQRNMPRRSPPRVGTLQDLVDQRRYMFLVCQTTGCAAGAVDVDIEAVIRERGDMPLQRFAELSRCKVCGAYEPRTICPPLDVGPKRSA